MVPGQRADLRFFVLIPRISKRHFFHLRTQLIDIFFINYQLPTYFFIEIAIFPFQDQIFYHTRFCRSCCTSYANIRSTKNSF